VEILFSISETHIHVLLFFRRFEERRLKKRAGFYALMTQKYGHIRKRNPHLPEKMPQWFKDKFQPQWLYGIHPKVAIFMKHRDKDPRILTTPFKH